MWFAHDGGSLAMISVDRLRKVRNLRRDPRVGVAVESTAGGALRCVTIRGHAEFVEAPEERAPWVERLVAKYAERLAGRWHGREMPADRVLFRIVPDRVTYWGHGE